MIGECSVRSVLELEAGSLQATHGLVDRVRMALRWSVRVVDVGVEVDDEREAARRHGSSHAHEIDVADLVQHVDREHSLEDAGRLVYDLDVAHGCGLHSLADDGEKPGLHVVRDDRGVWMRLRDRDRVATGASTKVKNARAVLYVQQLDDARSRREALAAGIVKTRRTRHGAWVWLLGSGVVMRVMMMMGSLMMMVVGSFMMMMGSFMMMVVGSLMMMMVGSFVGSFVGHCWTELRCARELGSEQ